MKKKFWRKVRDKIEDFLDVIDDKSPATVEDEDRLVASAPTFLAFIGAPIFLLGIVFLTKCIPKREYYGRRSYYFYDNTGIFVNRICLILESDSGS